MPSSVGPNIAGDSNLVFSYDTGDLTNSYKGKPTTNLLSTYFNTGYELNGGEFSQYADLAPIFDTYGSGSGVRYSLSMDIKVNSPGKQVLVYMQNGSSTKYGFVSQWIYPSTSYTRFTFNNLSANLSTPTDTRAMLAFYTIYGSRCLPSVKNVQVELGTAASPYVSGSRSTSGSLIDISGNNKIITLSNMSYDSNAQPYFDATDDFISLGSDVIFKTTGGWTVESVVYYNAVAGAYNNTTSPANFIGSETITYNSWYWSVFNNKLALWNRDPGYWRYGSTTIQPNRWYHVVLVSYTGGTSYRFYLNGVPENGDHVTQSWNPLYSGLIIGHIGKGNNTNPRLVNGKINITKVYNRELSEDEIYNNYNQYKTRFNF